jgi:membrane protein YdbS with pleckstrin-like domain
MRCAQCGFEAGVGVVFCSRCGTRLSQPRPAAVREYALSRIMRSWWHFAREFVMAFAMCAGGLFLLGESPGNSLLGLVLVLGSIILVGLAVCARRGMTWSLTSDRLIERRDLFASSRQVMELIDVRSIEVSRSLPQRLLGLGTFAVASAASAEFLIVMTDIRDPQHVADTLRQARLKRLA